MFVFGQTDAIGKLREDRFNLRIKIPKTHIGEMLGVEGN